MPPRPSRVRPLRVRPGARYRCFGDGLCCTDVHVIGPLPRSEVRRLEVFGPVASRANIGKIVPAQGGACIHLARSENGAPGGAGCRIHAQHGEAAKPSVCRRFPYRLVATPAGGRVTTEHRCPCRTMGQRPELDLEDAIASFGGASSRLSADLRVGDAIPIAPGRVVAFAEYAAIEAELLARVLAGDPVEALGVEPFPALDGVTWTDVAHHYRAELDGSACGDALAWYGDALLAMMTGTRRALRDRPWSPAFDRAEARSSAAAPEPVLADWIADELWGLEWTERGSLEDARHDLATRLAVAREIVQRLVAAGARPDRAAAEAVMIAELAGAAPLHRGVVNAFVRRGT